MNLVEFVKSFDSAEVKDILISVIVLGLLFSLIDFSVERMLASIVIVGLAFVLHEMGHKYLAMVKGLMARYVAWPTGLMFSLFFGIFSGGRIIFAAPGAVMISGKTRFSKYGASRLSMEDYGKISLAGPMMNIVFAVILSLFVGFHELIMFGIYINLFLALFNLLPFPPLDGSKVFMWSKRIWLLCFGLALSCLLLVGSLSPIMYTIVLLITTLLIYSIGISNIFKLKTH